MGKHNCLQLIAIAFILSAFLPLPVLASNLASNLAAGKIISVKKLKLVAGKSMVLQSPVAVKRISVAAPEIADIVLLSQSQVYINGKAAGSTNLTLWKNGSVSAIYDLEVVYDIFGLKQQVHELLPGEHELQIIGTHDSITLSGKISNAANMANLLALSRAYAPEGKINNLVTVGGVHQVMLEVHVAEMDRSTTKRLGINFNYFEDGRFGASVLAGLSSFVFPEFDSDSGNWLFDLPVSSSVGALFRFNQNGATWTGLIDALRQDGLVKILAEPNLIAMSGQEANFLAGGEFPVPVPQKDGAVTIAYKRFGVGLTFTPTVLSNKKISVRVEPEVSEVDFSTAVRFSGYVAPGLSTRKASTTIELGDGQSFAIAGLLKESVRDAVRKFPLLGDIPVLGMLFRSSSFQKNETELVIIVTPHLVQPVDGSNLTLPTDAYIEPNDVEFYLMGFTQGRRIQKKQDTFIGRMEGDMGHSLEGVEYPSKPEALP
ncbi:MAG: type II and III secretion system protein family protein [Desulfobacteraceae bacterium]|nr:type II and III secretion system protein family protein [Desulfobacteraceae bacterium]